MTHEELIYKYSENSVLYLQFLAKSSKKGLSTLFRKNQLISDSTCFFRGFFPDYTIIDEKVEQIDSSKLKFLKTAKISNNKFNHFLSMVDKYSKNGCQIFWFEAPTQKLKYFFDEAYRKDFEKLLAIVRANKQLKEIQLSDVKLNRNDYRNTDHLNSYGANKISAAVSAKLKDYLQQKN